MEFPNMSCPRCGSNKIYIQTGSLQSPYEGYYTIKCENCGVYTSACSLDGYTSENLSKVAIKNWNSGKVRNHNYIDFKEDYSSTVPAAFKRIILP